MPEKSVYLDTSVISALIDDRAPDRMRLTEAFWLELPSYRKYVSNIVLDEIEAASGPIKLRMLDAIMGFTVLQPGPAVEKLADQYVQNNIIPARYRTDALHLAIAVLNNVDYLVSWNFKHLVKVRTKDAVSSFNDKGGLHAIVIVAPPEL